MTIAAESKSNKIKYYWQLCDSNAVTMLRYIPEETFGDLVSRMNSKLMIHGYQPHYHTKDKQPIYIRDDEDLSIFMLLHEDSGASKQGLVLYCCSHFHCPKSMVSTI
jgi:hypothetical protein